MKKVVIIIGEGVEDTEFVYPYYRLREAGYHFDVTTKGEPAVTGKWGLPITASVDAEKIAETDYPSVVSPAVTNRPNVCSRFLMCWRQSGPLMPRKQSSEVCVNVRGAHFRWHCERAPDDLLPQLQR